MAKRDDIMIENAIYHTMDKFAFIGNMLQLLNIKYSNQVPTAGIGYNVKAKNFEMLINKEYFAGKTTTERSAVFQHEIFHVLFKHLTSVHHTRYLATQEEATKWNVSMDLSINQYIEGLPAGCMHIKDFKTKAGATLEPEKAFEYYYEEIDWEKAKKDFGYKPDPNCQVHGAGQQSQGASSPQNSPGTPQNAPGQEQGEGEGQGQGSGEGAGEQPGNQGMPQHSHHSQGKKCTCSGGLFPLDEHSIMNESAGNASQEELMKAMSDLLKRTQQKSSYGFSQAPKFVQDLLNELDKALSKINYKKILAKVIKKSVPADDRQGTWMRPSRRYGYQTQGTKSSEAPRVMVLLDTSGSISIDEINMFLGEVDAILKATKATVEIGLFHTTLYKTVKFKRGFGLKELDGLQSGGTCLQDAFDKMMKTKVDTVICLTDGYYSDISLKGTPHFKTVFCISKGGSLTHPLSRLGQTVSIV